MNRYILSNFLVLDLLAQKCELCPYKEGALKRTDTGGWCLYLILKFFIAFDIRRMNLKSMTCLKSLG